MILSPKGRIWVGSEGVLVPKPDLVSTVQTSLVTSSVPVLTSPLGIVLRFLLVGGEIKEDEVKTELMVGTKDCCDSQTLLYCLYLALLFLQARFWTNTLHIYTPNLLSEFPYCHISLFYKFFILHVFSRAVFST